jgi:hypothetical protein
LVLPFFYDGSEFFCTDWCTTRQLADVPVLTEHTLEGASGKKDCMRWDKDGFFPVMKELGSDSSFFHPTHTWCRPTVYLAAVLTETTRLEQAVCKFYLQIKERGGLIRVFYVERTECFLMVLPENLGCLGWVKCDGDVFTITIESASILLKDLVIFWKELPFQHHVLISVGT